jgi:RimJ/RimL family protein N-acetyltransferase
VFAIDFSFHPLDADSAREVLSWRYDEPYDIYNADAQDLEADLALLLDPRNAHHAITAAGDLLAFCCFGPEAQVPGGEYEAGLLDVGLGVRPDLTGQGHGDTYVRAVLDFAAEEFAPGGYRVTVAEFNERALRVWERACFRRVQRFERGVDCQAFWVLVRTEDGNRP